MRSLLLFLAVLVCFKPAFGIAAWRDNCRDLFAAVGLAESTKELRAIEEIVLKEVDVNYKNLPPVTAAEAKAWNGKLYDVLNALLLEGTERGRKAGLKKAELQAIYDKVYNHPVTSCSKNKAKYDPKGNIGFCFGRAMSIHLEALRAGVAKEHIKKIWAIGTMDYNNIQWGHHVATMVRRDDGYWYVIDPEYGGVIELKKWMQETTDLNKDGTLRFFASDPKRFGLIPDKYTKLELNDGYYNDYFADLLKSGREESAQVVAEMKKNKFIGPPGRSPSFTPGSTQTGP